MSGNEPIRPDPWPGSAGSGRPDELLMVRRVVVVDDHELLRTGTRRILDDATGFSVVGEAGDAETALRVIAETKPDLVLVDIRLPGTNGIELARQIAADFPSTTVLILSAYDDENYVRGVAGSRCRRLPSQDDAQRRVGARHQSRLWWSRYRRLRTRHRAWGSIRPTSAGCPSQADGEGARGGSPRRPGDVEQGHRPAARHQPSHRRRAPEPCVRQAGHDLAHRTGPLRTGQQSLPKRAGGKHGTDPVSSSGSRSGIITQERLPLPAGSTSGSTAPDPASGSDGTGGISGKSPFTAPPAEKPWTNSRFWVLQLIILALYLIRLAATVAFHLDINSQALEYSTIALFLVPVVFSALNYGVRGALFTSAWVTILAIPRFVLAVGNRDYVAAWAEFAQVVLLDALAVLVGQRVTAEREARRSAEFAQQAHLSAEALYRDLFDSNQAPILIVDGDGNVVETNASAQRAFAVQAQNGDSGPKRPHSPTAPIRLVDMIGPIASGHVLTRLISEQLPDSTRGEERTAEDDRITPIMFEVEGQPVLYRPTATMLGRSQGGTRMQIVFEDVTAETRRRDLMEAYAARVVAGQEEERRHIAQELHDGPVQTLIHLCRQIDSMESRTGPAPDGALGATDLRTIVEDTVAELRSIAKGLRPSVLDDLGLVASINQILADAGERHQFEISFGVTGSERRLAPTVELTLFRIAQEAISNIERHAAAHRVAVGLNFEPQGLRLLVKDDGIGFDGR